MESRKIYEDIARRTDGCIYLGVVGPVRTGKSTFIKRFMESLVIPKIQNEYKRQRAVDELPQSGSGRTIMTAEPKFVPEEAVEIEMDGGTRFMIRLIDCVGYMVDGAVGQLEGDMPRMVMTPWFDHEIPMKEAAEIGTRKVIAEHSTIGIVITTDGTITDIERGGYINAEDRVIQELKEIGKPFLVIVNSTNPASERAQSLCSEIAQKHEVTCLAANCLTLSEEDVERIIKAVLCEFPISELQVFMPAWVDALPFEHQIKSSIYAKLRENTRGMRRIKDAEEALAVMSGDENVSNVGVRSMDMGTGAVVWVVELPRELFYATLSEQSGFDINDDGDLMPLLASLKTVKSEYDRIADALREVGETGYGIVMPGRDELRLEEPEIVRRAGKYGVRLKASAPSIHMIRADVQTEVAPVMSGESQSEEIINFLLQEFEGDTGKLWQSNIFGKSLNDIANEGLAAKLKRMPEEAKGKFQETLQRIINEGGGGLICIIL